MPPKKKLAPRKPEVAPKDHEDEGVKVSVQLEKRDYNGGKTVTQKKGAYVEDVESNPVNTIPEGRALVGLSKGYTINTGNFESAKINCWISRPCKDDEVEIMNNMAEISQLIDEQIEFEVSELKEEE